MNIKKQLGKLALFCSAAALLSSCDQKKREQHRFLYDIKYNEDSTGLVIKSAHENTPGQIHTMHYKILKDPIKFMRPFEYESQEDLIKLTNFKSEGLLLSTGIKLEYQKHAYIYKPRTSVAQDQVTELFKSFDRDLDARLTERQPSLGEVDFIFVRSENKPK